MKTILILFTLLACSCALFSQEAKNPVSTVVRETLTRQRANLVAAVEEMPADKFAFKPTDQQETFAHLALHITKANNFFCSKIEDAPEPKTDSLKDTDSKEKLVDALKASFDFCEAAVTKCDDSKMGDPIEAFGGHKEPRAWAWIALTSNWADHYAAAAMYLRLNGLLPPTAQAKK